MLERLRSGDEAAFAELVDRLSPGLMRMARIYVATDAAAEEVVQDTWLGVLRGLDRFEGRSSLTTWVFQILINTAKTRGVRDARSIPFSSAFEAAADSGEPVLGEGRFTSAHDRWPHYWAIGPTPWPDEALETAESLRTLHEAVERLPPAQREVIVLRDLVGCPAGEVCNALGLTETNQRVLLHRARSKVREALERELDAMEPTA